MKSLTREDYFRKAEEAKEFIRYAGLVKENTNLPRLKSNLTQLVEIMESFEYSFKCFARAKSDKQISAGDYAYESAVLKLGEFIEENKIELEEWTRKAYEMRPEMLAYGLVYTAAIINNGQEVRDCRRFWRG